MDSRWRKTCILVALQANKHLLTDNYTTAQQISIVKQQQRQIQVAVLILIILVAVAPQYLANHLITASDIASLCFVRVPKTDTPLSYLADNSTCSAVKQNSGSGSLCIILNQQMFLVSLEDGH